MTEAPDFLLETPKPPVCQPIDRRDVTIAEEAGSQTVPKSMKSGLKLGLFAIGSAIGRQIS
jgi:hypothetical protein